MDVTIFLDAPRSRTADDFLIRDVPGTSGRLDVVCRVLAATYRTVPQFSPFLSFLALLGGPPAPPLLLKVKPSPPGSIPESELACALVLKGILHQHRTKGEPQHRSWPQISLNLRNFEDAVNELTYKQAQIYYLTKQGTALESINFDLSKPIVFALGDDRGLPKDHEEILSQHVKQEVRVGKQSLLGSHVVTLVLLDLARRFDQEQP